VIPSERPHVEPPLPSHADPVLRCLPGGRPQAGRRREANEAGPRVQHAARRQRADDPPAHEHFLRRPRPHVGSAIPPVPELRGPQAREAGSIPAHDLGQVPRAAAEGAERARPHHDLLRPGRERRVHEEQGLRDGAEHRQRVLHRARRRVCRAAAVPPLLPGQESGRRAGRRPRSAALRLRHGRHALARQLAPVGAGRLALRRGRQHQHLQDQEPGEPEGSDRVPTGPLALSREDEALRTLLRGRRQHLRTGLRPQRPGDRQHQLGRLRHASPDAGRVSPQGLLEAWPAAQPAHLRPLRTRALHRLQRRARDVRRHRLSGGRIPSRVPQPIHRRERALERHLLASDGGGEVQLQSLARRRTRDRERPVVPADRLPAGAGRFRVRRRFLRRPRRPPRPRGHVGPDEWPRVQARIHPSERRASALRVCVRSPQEDVGRTRRTAQAFQQVVAKRSEAAPRRAAGQERSSEAASDGARREGRPRARSSLGAVRLGRLVRSGLRSTRGPSARVRSRLGHPFPGGR